MFTTFWLYVRIFYIIYDRNCNNWFILLKARRRTASVSYPIKFCYQSCVCWRRKKPREAALCAGVAESCGRTAPSQSWLGCHSNAPLIWDSPSGSWDHRNQQHRVCHSSTMLEALAIGFPLNTNYSPHASTNGLNLLPQKEWKSSSWTSMLISLSDYNCPNFLPAVRSWLFRSLRDLHLCGPDVDACIISNLPSNSLFIERLSVIGFSFSWWWSCSGRSSL